MAGVQALVKEGIGQMFINVLRLVVGMLPSGWVKRYLLCLSGWEIDPTAVFGPTLLLRVERMVLGPNCRIGFLNVMRDLKSVELEEGAIIGQWNWMSAALPLIGQSSPASAGRFKMLRQSSMSSRHYVDASGGVTIGAFATVAGVRSTFITHGVDINSSMQSTARVEIGDYSILGSNSKLTPGSTVPSHSFVAMGSVVTRGLDEPYKLYAGTPARAVRNIPRQASYFARRVGPVASPADAAHGQPDASVTESRIPSHPDPQDRDLVGPIATE